MSKKLYLGNTARIICPVDGSRPRPQSRVPIDRGRLLVFQHLHGNASFRDKPEAILSGKAPGSSSGGPAGTTNTARRERHGGLRPVERGVGSCRGPEAVVISPVVRRDLTTIAVIGALLWAVSGVSVLALVLHQHSHHFEVHDHHDALQAAVHGHSHEGSPDHDHEFTVPLSLSWVSSAVHLHVVGSEGFALPDNEPNPVRAAATAPPRMLDQRVPPYLENCVFLT